MDIGTIWHCTLVSGTQPQSIRLFSGCALFWCWVLLWAPVTISLIELYFVMIFIMLVVTIIGILMAIHYFLKYTLTTMLFFIFFFSHLNALQYDDTLFSFTLFFMSQIVLYFLHSTSVLSFCIDIQYIPRNMHTVFVLLCIVVVIHWLIFPYPSGLLHWHCGNLTISPVPAKQPWWIWINTSCEFIMNDCITTTKQSTTKPCAYFLGYTVWPNPINPML